MELEMKDLRMEEGGESMWTKEVENKKEENGEETGEEIPFTVDSVFGWPKKMVPLGYDDGESGSSDSTGDGQETPTGEDSNIDNHFEVTTLKDKAGTTNDAPYPLLDAVRAQENAPFIPRNNLQFDFENLTKVGAKGLSGRQSCTTVVDVVKTPIMTNKPLLAAGGGEEEKKRQKRSFVYAEMTRRLREMAASQLALKAEVKMLREKVQDLESQKSFPANGQNRGITKGELMNFIIEAINSCTTGIGCSKAYIKKYLCDRYEVPLSAHYGRKIGMLIHEGVMMKKIHFDPAHNLYKL